MITALYQWLISKDNLTQVNTWYQAETPAANNPNTTKPYGIIEPGGLIPMVSGTAGKQQVELHLVFPVGSWVNLMEAAEELRSKLNGKMLKRSKGGECFIVEWATTVGGIHDPTLKAFIYTVIFSIPLRT